MSSTSPQAFSWTSVEGHTVIREIVEERIPQWTKGPRPAQLDCWSHTLASRPTILIASTGWGKTTAFFIPIIVLQHLSKHPRLRIPNVPSRPVALVITPLIELGNAHAREISEFGLSVLSLTAESLQSASKEGRNLLKEVCEGQWSIVLLSAERLVSPEVDSVLRNPTFRQNLVLLGVDETHVLVPWGKDFRQAYYQISALLHRLPSHTALVAVSATISPGEEFNSLCSALGLKAGQADTRLVFRVAYYGWNLYPEGCRRHDNVRLWTSITSAAYNSKTLDLFKDNEDTSVIVATIAFGMGMNLCNISDSINLGLPTTYAGLVQQNGRAGRNEDMDARGWTYVESSICSAVAEEVAQRSNLTTTASKGNKRVDNMDSNLHDMVEAHVEGICLIATANRASGNPGEDALLTCAAAKRRLFCSSCRPYPSPSATLAAPLPLPPPPTIVFVEPNMQTTPAPAPLTKKTRASFLQWLDDFAIKQWNSKDDMYASFLPYPALWHGISPDYILDHFHQLTARESINVICAQWKYLDSDGDELFELLQKLRRALEEHTQKTKEERARRAAAMRAKNKATQPPRDSAKENQQPIIPTTAAQKLTVRIPGRPLANRNGAVDDRWEPPPLDVAFEDLLKKRPLTLDPLDENVDLSSKRHRLFHQP